MSVEATIRDLVARVVDLEQRVASISQRQGAATGPIKRAFFGVVTKWQKNKVTACPMPFGDPNDWGSAEYDEDHEICNCYAPGQLFGEDSGARDVVPVMAIQFWNTDRPIVIPLYLLVDDHAEPDLPYWEPDPSELEDPAEVTGGPPAFDDINCPGEE